MTECTAAPPHFSSSYCKFVKCGDYRKDPDGIGQKRCQITGYIPGNMSQCPHDMDPGTLKKYCDSIQGPSKDNPTASSPHITGKKTQAAHSHDNDPICQECCLTISDPEGKNCKWCNEEQEKHGRRAALSRFNKGVLYCRDSQDAIKDLFPESIDLIFTDPPYVADQWEEAYNTLADIGKRVLKPSGFL